MTQERPLERLCGLAHGRLSGEFICVAPTLEVHVYLREGRIAWGADARQSVTLTAHLQKTANIDPETLRNVVEECRRDRRPLGETLVSWGLATRQQLRESLRQQIAPTLSLLSKAVAARTLFLEREYVLYDRELTFDLDDLLEDSVVARAREAALSTSLRPLLTSGFAEQLLESIEGAAWVEILEGDRVLDGAPNLELPRTCPVFLEKTLHDGADFVAVRSPRGSVIGLSLRLGQRSLWCRLEANSTFGAALSTLWSFALGGASSFAGNSRVAHGLDWSLGPEDAPDLEVLRAFQARSPEILAAAVLRARREPVACGSRALAVEEALHLAERRGRSLEAFRDPDIGRGRSIVTGESGLFCFGAELPSSPGSKAGGEDTLWIFLSRSNSQGLGWAYLSALTRALAVSEHQVAS